MTLLAWHENKCSLEVLKVVLNADINVSVEKPFRMNGITFYGVGVPLNLEKMKNIWQQFLFYTPVYGILLQVEHGH
jgi:hypothetical protein